MDAVKIFNGELCSLYELKPPISKAKMSQITKTAIKAIKFYKHIVQSVEKFIQKCRPEYKVPGLYIVDSIIRQSRKQFGPEKDMFALRFSKNIVIMFNNLFDCPQEDIAKMIRVLNLWQKNNVYGPEIIQPLLDLAADPHNEMLFESVQQKVELVTGMTPSMPLKSDQKPPALTADALQLGFVAQNSDQSVAPTLNNPDMTQILSQIMQTLTCPPIIPSMPPSVMGTQQLQLMQQTLMHHATSVASTTANIIPSISNPISFNPATFAEHNLMQYDGTNLLTQLQVITQQLLASSNSIIQKSANNASTSSPNETNTDLEPSNIEDRRISSLDRRLDAIKAGRESDFCYDDEEDADAESGLHDSTKNEEYEIKTPVDHRLTVTVKNSALQDNQSLSHRSSRNMLLHSSRHDNLSKSTVLNPAYNDASPISGCSETSEEHMGYEAEEGEVIERPVNYTNYSSEDDYHYNHDKTKKIGLKRGSSHEVYKQSPEYFWAEKQVKERIDEKLYEKRKRKYSGEDLNFESNKNIRKKVEKDEEENYQKSHKKSKMDIKSSNSLKDTKQNNSKIDKYYDKKTHKSRSRSYSDGSTSDPMYDPFKHKEIRSVVSKPDNNKNPCGNDYLNDRVLNCKFNVNSKLNIIEKNSGKLNNKNNFISDSKNFDVNDLQNKEVIDPKLKSVCSKIFDEKLNRYSKADKTSKDFKLKLKISKDIQSANDIKNKESSHQLINQSKKFSKSGSKLVDKHISSGINIDKVSKTNDSVLSTSKVNKIPGLSASNSDTNDVQNSRERSRSNENIKTDQKKRNYRTNAKLRRKSPVIVIEASPIHSDDSTSSVEFVTNPKTVSKQLRNPNLPPMKPQHISICSTTLWIGRINKVVSEEEIKSALSKYTILSINIVPPRGCAFVTFGSRADACQALEFLKDAALLGSNSLKVAWAAGNGIKTSDFFCHVEHGVTYIPWERIKTLKLNELLEGGVLDEETLPPGYKIDETEIIKESVNTSLVCQDTVLDIPIPVISSTSLPIASIPSLPFASLPYVSSPNSTLSVETLPLTTISVAPISIANLPITTLSADQLSDTVPLSNLPPPNFAFFSINQVVPPPPMPPTLMKPSFIPPALIFPGAPPPLLRSKINISIRKQIARQSVPFHNKYAIYNNLEKDNEVTTLINNQLDKQSNIIEENMLKTSDNLKVIEPTLENCTDCHVVDMELCNKLNADETIDTISSTNTNLEVEGCVLSKSSLILPSSQFQQTQINSVIEKIIETNNKFIDVINKSVEDEEDEGNMEGMYSPSYCYRDVPPVAVSFGKPPPSVSSINVCYNSSMTRLSIEAINCSLNNSYSVQSASNYNYPQIIKNDNLNLQWQSNMGNAPLSINQGSNNISLNNVPSFPNFQPPIFPIRNVLNDTNTFNIQPMFNKEILPFSSIENFNLQNNSNVNSLITNFNNPNVNHNLPVFKNPIVNNSQTIINDFTANNNPSMDKNSSIQNNFPSINTSNDLNFKSSNFFINDATSKGLLPDFSSNYKNQNASINIQNLFLPHNTSLHNEHGVIRASHLNSSTFNTQNTTNSTNYKYTQANSISSDASKTYSSSINQQVSMNVQNAYMLELSNSSIFSSPASSLSSNSIQNMKCDLIKSSTNDTKSRNLLKMVGNVSDSSQLESLINSISESNQLIRNALTDELPRIHNLTRNMTPNKMNNSVTNNINLSINNFLNHPANINIIPSHAIFNQPKVLLNSTIPDIHKMNTNTTLRPRNIDISRPPPLLLNPMAENIMRPLNPIVSPINAQILRPPPTLLLNPQSLNINSQQGNNLTDSSRPLLMNPTMRHFNPQSSTNFFNQKLTNNEVNRLQNAELINRMQLNTGMKATVNFNPNQPPPQIPILNNAVSCRILVNTPPQNVIRMAVDGNNMNIENIRLMAPPRLANSPTKSSNILPQKNKQSSKTEDGLLGEFDPTMHGDKKKVNLLTAEPPKVPLIAAPIIREALPLRSTTFDPINYQGPSKSIQEGVLKPNIFDGFNIRGPPKLNQDGSNQHPPRLGPPPSAKNIDGFSRLPPPPHLTSISALIRRPLLREAPPGVIMRPGTLDMMRRPGPGPVDIRMMMRRPPPPFSRRSIR